MPLPEQARGPGRPRKEPEKRLGARLQVYVDSETVAKVKALASRLGLDDSGLLRKAIEGFLKAHGETDKIES